ncbi:MAG: ABC transporter permease, partial [Clostridia bacterium]|nr:ABC transporter permease [Clostridia bacterium]
ESGEWRMKLVSQIVANDEEIERYEKFESEYEDKDYAEYVKQARTQNEIYWKLIEDNDFTLYISQAKDTCSYVIDSLKGESDTIKDAVGKRGDKYTESEKELALAVAGKYSQTAELADRFFKEAVANGMSGSAADTRLVDAIAATLSSGRGFGFEEKGDYTRGDYSDIIIYDRYDRAQRIDVEYAYEAFLEDLDSAAEELLSKVAVAEYAVANGNTEITTARSLRYNLFSLVTGVFFGMLILLGICAAVTTVASEFSRKTVNMLVIRPVSRSCIVAAKFAACLAFVYAVALAGTLLAVLVGSLKFGMGDLFQPYIYWNGSAAAGFPFFIWFLWRAFLASLNVVFYVALSFCLAMLIRHTAGAMVVSFVVYAFSSAVNLIRYWLFSLIAEDSGVFLYPYLPLTYLDYRTSVFDDVPRLYGGYTIADLNIIVRNLFNDISGFGLLYGAVMLAALSVLFYFIANRSFAKRDIKS